MKKLFNSFLLWRINHISDRSFLLILSVLVGILAGLTAWVLKSGVFYMHKSFRGSLQFDPRNFRLILYPLIGILITVLFKVYIIKDNIKHNISSILHAISKQNSLMKLHKIYSSITGAILTAGFGGSIGLESPIISSGAAIGSNIGKACKLNYKSITLLLGCGAAGAISAIFNTPIAGIVFVLEVLLLDLNRFSLIPLLMAATSGTITTKLLFADEIFFEFNISQSFDISNIGFFILLGILAGIASNYFTRMFIAIEDFFGNIPNRFTRLIIGAPILGILIFIFPALYGEGFDVIKAMLSGNADMVFQDSIFSSWVDSAWIFGSFFLALILLKVIATAITTGAGGIGGVFAPALFSGAILGFMFARFNNVTGISELSERSFALVGMASVLGGVLQAPLTGIFLIAEITSGYELIVPLMLSTTISYVTSRYLTSHSIITYQLEKRGELVTHHKDKAILHFLDLKTMVETDFSILNESAKLEDLVKIISKSKRNIFPIVNNDNFLVGIILLDDVREIMFDPNLYNTELVSIMQTPPAIIDISSHMEDVMQEFKETEAWNLPVCEEGKYIGFVSKSKLFSAYRTKLMDITEE